MAHGHLNATACSSMARCTHHHQTHPHTAAIRSWVTLDSAHQGKYCYISSLFAYECMLSHLKDAPCYDVVCAHCAVICRHHAVNCSARLLPGSEQDHALTCCVMLCCAVAAALLCICLWLMMIQAPHIVSLPMRPKPKEPARQVQMKILTRFEFDRDFLMSAVIAQQQGTTTEQPELYLKGSPAAISPLIGFSNLPRDWSQVQSSPHSESAYTACTFSGMPKQHSMTS